MSVEFSGQITRSGSGAAPAATSAASRWVAATWLSQHRPRCAEGVQAGPRHVALDDGDREVRRSSVGFAFGGKPDQAARGADHRDPDEGRGDQARPAVRTDNATQASSDPTRAIANVTAGAPPSAAYGVSVVAVCPKANRPQGNPPRGTRSRPASCATQSSGTTSGHHRRPLVPATAPPSSAIHSAQ